VGSIDPEVLLSDRRLLEKVNQVLNAKLGVDQKTFLSLKAEHQKNQQMYLNLFAAIEDELLNKGDMKLHL